MERLIKELNPNLKLPERKYDFLYNKKHFLSDFFMH